jgi:hypothetical protein
MLWCGAFTACFWVLWWLLASEYRKIRIFETELHQRTPISDEEFATCYSLGGRDAPDVASRVRRVFAEHTGYPAEKILPDDDFWRFVADLDADALLKALEQEFAVTVPDAEAASMSPTVRSVSLAMAKLVQGSDQE